METYQNTVHPPVIPTEAPVPPQAPTQAQAPAAPQAQAPQQTGAPAGNGTIKTVSKVTYTATQLFEVTGFLDISQQWPKANAFLMFVPGQQDSTKASGRTYVQAQKEIMKVSSREVFALGEALKFAAMYNQCDYMTFTDSSKSEFHKDGQASVKKITVTAAPSRKDPNKYMIFLTYQGNQKITVTLEKWAAIGLGNQLINLAQYTDQEKFRYEDQVHAQRRQG